MKQIETKISPLIESQFPTFYQNDGANFISFVKAYYEWLEQNHQILQLEDTTNFNVGDTIQQDQVTGTIIAFVDGDILVRVDGLETFKCFNICNELILVTSSSGGSSYILRGGTTRRLGALFLSRNLLNIRDVDTTIDLFINHFKEKYLRNIEFDTQTDKKMLIKNALDLYRSKGTERSIDLFFRLIYGTSAKVVFPGENNLFRLSDADWVKPQYIEITGNSKERAISLVGKQVRGLYSGASAFVEKYVRRKIKNGFVDILYITNVKGTFRNNEQLYVGILYPDSPKVVGSLTSVTVIQGSTEFSVGDIVQFNSVRGDYGLARVVSIEDTTGVVDFIFIDGGYGYTVSGNTSFDEDELAKRTQSIVSEKVLTITNVTSSNAVTRFTVSSGGSGYTNGDIAVVPSAFVNATGLVTTTSTGVVNAVTITNTGSGFYTLNPSVSITNSTGGATGGASAVIVAHTDYQNEYYRYFEPLTQLQATLEVSSITNASAFVEGSTIRIANAVTNSAVGVIQSISANTTAGTGNIVITFANASAASIVPTIVAGNSIYLTTNSSVNGVITVVSNTSAEGYVMGLPTRGSLKLTSLSSSNVVVSDTVYQINSRGVELANADISSIESVTVPTATISFTNLNGVLRKDMPLYFRNKSITAVVDEVTVEVGVYNISNAYTNNYSAGSLTRLSGTTGNVISVSQGTGAGFKVDTITDTETIYINSDLLSANNEPPEGANQTFMSVGLNNLFYGFPKNPYGNSESVIFSCLNFDSFEIGTISTLNQINPGIDYNVDPYVLAYQPYVSGFNLNDYTITIRNPRGTFRVGERIDQVSTSTTTYDLAVNQDLGFQVGQRVYQTNSTSNSASGIINSINPSLNIINVRNVTGEFVPTDGSNSSLIGVGVAQTAIVYNAATNNQLYPVGSEIKLGTSAKFIANSAAVLVGNSTSNGFILLGANTTKFANNTKVLYYVPPSNTAIGGLANNRYYYTRSINSTAIQLANTAGAVVNLSSVPATAQQHIIIKYNATGSILLNSNSSLAAANGTMYAKFSSGTVKTGDVIYLTSNLEVQANAVSFTNSAFTTAISNSTIATELSSAKAIVTFANTTIVKAKRTQFENKFVANSVITGASSGANATIVSIAEDETTLPIGINAVIEANVIIANGAVTSLQIVDSGVGYRNGEDIIFLSEDESRAGVARASVSGIGTGAGYYKTSRGFLSALSKIHDGDYYQEYSYDVLTRLPFSKYKDMYKKVMHTAGTRVFGSVNLEEYFAANIDFATSEILSKNIYEVQFNSFTNVSSNSIIFNNKYVNNDIAIANSTKVLYYTAVGNSVIKPLSNNNYYYASQVNSTSIKLVTNPRTISQSFNSNSDIDVPGYINLPRHNFKTGDYVRYSTNSSANAVIGLVANANYFVHVANDTHVQMSVSANTIYTNMSNSSVLSNGSYTLASTRGRPTGLAFKPDGTKMFVAQSAQNYISEYTLTIPWQVNTASFTTNSAFFYSATGSLPSTSQGVTFKPDGTKMYIITGAGDRFGEFNLSTPWQVNTATISQTLDLAPSANSITVSNSAIDIVGDFISYPAANSIFANSTIIYLATTAPGQTMLSSLANNVTFYVRYANSSGFQLGSLPTGVVYNFTSAGTGTYKIKQTGLVAYFEAVFNTDGTKLFITRNNTFTDEYTLSTPWDISTATLTYTRQGLNSFSTQGLIFVDNGSKAYMTGALNTTINGFDLTKPFDLSTATRDSFTKGSIPANTFAIAVKPDLSKVYIADNVANSIIEYDWFTSLPNQNETHSLSITTINIVPTTTSQTGHYISISNEN